MTCLPPGQLRRASHRQVEFHVRAWICKLLRNVAYRQHNSVTQNIVVRWVRGLPQKRDECWFLISSLDAGPAQISKLYSQRMTIEQLFRDHKSKRNGWSLRDTKLKTAERLDRLLLLLLALAYLLLCGLGLLAAATQRPSAWCSNSKDGTCSVFVIGQVMLTKLKRSAPQAFAAFLRVSQEAVPKWG